MNQLPWRSLWEPGTTIAAWLWPHSFVQRSQPRGPRRGVTPRGPNPPLQPTCSARRKVSFVLSSPSASMIRPWQRYMRLSGNR